MAFNGSGTFTRDNGTHTGSTVWAQDNAAGTKIVDTIHDLHDQDIADGLTNCLTKDGQTTPTANLPMGNFKHTGVASGTARTHYTSVAQLQDQGPLWGGTSGGSATAYTISLTPAISAYVQGQQFRFIAHALNTGTATLAVNGLTAYQINRNSSTIAAKPGEIEVGAIVTVVYDTTGGSHFRILNEGFHDFTRSCATAVTAAGSAATDSTLLTKVVNIVSTVASGTGVQFSDAYPEGLPIYVRNTGANDLKVYPQAIGGTINGAASVTLGAASNKADIFVRAASGTWYSVNN